MKIVWDEPKRLANLDKHGLDFADLNETFFDSALVLPSHQNRWLGIGKNMHGVIVVVFVALGKEAVSLISVRPASKNERKLYAKS
ncbi:MAG: BrnT family toxin [Bradyrhizobium sp.]